MIKDIRMEGKKGRPAVKNTTFLSGRVVGGGVLTFFIVLLVELPWKSRRWPQLRSHGAPHGQQSRNPLFETGHATS